MRPILNALVILLILHALALLGFVGWLKMSGRLDRARVAKVKEVLYLTIAEEKAVEEQAAKLAEETQKKTLEAARLESVAANGAVSLSERLNAQQQADEMSLQRVERLQRDISDLRHQLVTAKDLLAKQKADLDTERKAFEALASRETKLKEQADFQQAVATYEQLKPRQVKEMFQTLLKQGSTPQVVDYLAAMQTRKTAAVLKEFKTPEEIVQATNLVEKLRERGIEPQLEKNSPVLANRAGDST